MKRRMLTTLVLMIAMVGISAGSALGQTAKERQMVKKSHMEREVRKEILSLPYYGVFDAIGYEINGSTVTLNGYVVRPYTKKEAGAAVKDINGVTSVVNKIQVLPPSPSDDRIRVRAYRAIANQGNLYRYLLGANPAIRIVVDNGRVILEGQVAYRSDKTLAQVAATQIFGVLSVQNNLTLERSKGADVG